MIKSKLKALRFALFSFLVVSSVILCPASSIFSASIGIGHSFYGTVYIGGEAATSGTVTASVSGGPSASSSISSNGSYGLTIQGTSDDDGSTITFKVNGTSAGSSSYVDGRTQQKNLSIAAATPTTTTTTTPTTTTTSTTTTTTTTSATTIEVNGNAFYISSSGEILEEIEATSDNGNFTITIPEGTFALDNDGNPLDYLTIEEDEDPPTPPEDAYIIGLTYKFLPAGATFDPEITFEFSYDDSDIPEGVNEEDMVIAYYDEDTGEWVELVCEVDTVNNVITAYVNHFTTFAIVASATTSSPDFSVSNLNIIPTEVQAGGAVGITATVSNTGNNAGSYVVVLNVNGVKEAEQSVTLAANASQNVIFYIIRQAAGTYNVNIDGLNGSFTVIALSPTEATTITKTEISTATIENQSTATMISTLTLGETTILTSIVDHGTDGLSDGLIISCIIGGAIIVAGLIVYFAARRRY